MMKFLALLLFFLPNLAWSVEADYVKAWCTPDVGQIEYVLPDRTRVDCLTETHAIEFDFQEKWAESIGQSLYYAVITHKKPGIVIIVRNPDTLERYLKRLYAALYQSGMTHVDVWVIGPDL